VPQKGEAGPRILMSNRQELELDWDAIVGVAERTLSGEGSEGVELSLSFVTPGEMEGLHFRYLGEEGPTDVLSFPLGEDGLLGDVVVCPVEASRNNPDLQAEVRLLVAHGVLHLLGYHHEEEDQRAAMWAKQAHYSS